MRDILVTLIVFGSLPFILKRPYFGVIMWVWLSVMNPHTQGWGFATSFPFAAVVAGTTMLGMLFTRDEKSLPMTPFTWVLLIFALWMSMTTVFAFYPAESYVMWKRVMKILLMTFVALMLIKSRKQINQYIWILVISLAFYGVKGGIFTIRGGGADLVWGPENTFIGGNNEIALALVVIIPMLRYVQLISTNRWIRHGLTAAMVLCALAALGSYSRGALLAIAAMSAFLWLKSRQKLRIGLVLLILFPLMLAFMPARWTERMDTIQTYDQDASAMGRINAWKMAFNLASDRPLTGGGFEIYDPATFARYAPIATDIHAAHSIYFQALGEHGFVGLLLYLVLAVITWRNGAWIVRQTAKREDLAWANHLALMTQVSLIGFWVGGAFLSLLYFDVPYYLMVAMVATRVLIAKETAAEGRPSLYPRRGPRLGATVEQPALPATIAGSK
jgi:putative inorganic carbon (HCO3(-)) transporter